LRVCLLEESVIDLSLADLEQLALASSCVSAQIVSITEPFGTEL
jgi:hypothetical protein